jgi:hypothetical protein
MVLLIIVGLVPAACAELMPDGGFEGAGVWSGYGGYFSDTAGYWQYAVINTTADAHTGSKALIMTAPGSSETWAYSPNYPYSTVFGTFDLGASGWAAQWQAGLAATEGDVFQATAWVKEKNGVADTGVALLKVELKNAAGDTLGDPISVYGDVTADWTQILLPPFIVPGASQGQTVDSLSVVVGIEAGNNGAYHSVVFDDVSLTVPPGKALIPDPAVGATDVPVTAVLTWITGDPNTTNDEVYFGKTALYPDPATLPLVATLSPGVETWDPPGDLEYGTEYSWRVDEMIDLTPPPSDPVYENEGDVWSFTTITQRPLITSQPDAVFANPNGSMTVVATDYLGGTANLTYQWYNSSGALSDDSVISGSSGSGASSTLTFTAATEDYADSYYCIVEDTVQALTTTSDSALMDVPRLYAHFTFEPDTVSGVNVDNIISGNPEGEYYWDTGEGGPVAFGEGHNGAQAIEFEDLRDNPLGDDDDEWMISDPSILDPVVANGKKQMTIAMWAYLDEAVTARQSLFSVLENANWDAILGAYCPTTNGGGTISFEGEVGAESVEWTMPDPNDLLGQWHHFAFSKNVDTGDMKLYMNGDLKNTTNATLADIVTTDLLGVYLGVATNYNESFTGRMDDFRLYNYALSDADVAQLYACTSLAYDLDFSCNVDLIDYATLAEGWGGAYDLADLVGLCSEWLDDNN